MEFKMRSFFLVHDLYYLVLNYPKILMTEKNEIAKSKLFGNSHSNLKFLNNQLMDAMWIGYVDDHKKKHR